MSLGSSTAPSFEDRLSHVLAKRARKVISEEGLRPSAVILPLFVKEGRRHLLFTRRTEEVRHHKGQISFPGGASHPSDRDILATARRECFEEVGILEEDLRIIGALDDARTLSDYRITPFVATFCYPYPFVINPMEVAEIIEVPLGALTDEAIFRKEIRLHRGEPFPVYYYRFNDHVIWGATARIVREFIILLQESGIPF